MHQCARPASRSQSTTVPGLLVNPPSNCSNHLSTTARPSSQKANYTNGQSCRTAHVTLAKLTYVNFISTPHGVDINVTFVGSSYLFPETITSGEEALPAALWHVGYNLPDPCLGIARVRIDVSPVFLGMSIVPPNAQGASCCRHYCLVRPDRFEIQDSGSREVGRIIMEDEQPCLRLRALSSVSSRLHCRCWIYVREDWGLFP